MLYRAMRFQPATELPAGLSGQAAKWFVFNERHQLLVVDNVIPVTDSWSDNMASKYLLGIETDAAPTPDRAVWGGRCTDQFPFPEGSVFIGLREAFAVLDEDEWVMAGRASQVLGWADDHAFCGRCGTGTAPQATDRAMRCPACGLAAFPRLTPAVITLVERSDGKALLAWGRQFPGRFFSALAGFVEAGESLEQAVIREVREEVGIEVDDIRYFGSQPWPFPNSLMIGFNASYVGGELKLQESEIVEAGWFGPDELPPVPRGRMSIAGWLIEDWMQRRDG